MPVECTLGQDCYIQNYVDRDPGPGARDAGCGGLTYDGHKGTDFALLTGAQMKAGVQVIAAAPGRVIATRDGEPDGAYVGGETVADKECGNGIVIDLGNGWQTQYCHLREGSISVNRGDRVKAGEPLGLVGQSGQAEFPHLHLSLRHDVTVVDPFDPDMQDACATNATQTLWSAPITYRPSGWLEAGLTATVPRFETVLTGAPLPPPRETGPALVLWGYGFGLRAGDTIGFEITGPDGISISTTSEVDASKTRFFRYAGKKVPPGGWPKGTYAGQITLSRDGAVIARRTLTDRID
ncbi:M23 family metallopeptidase [Thioclava sp. DLFJ5-1]|uniref:M23 family metallopeptidase n=1 Tax=Thioclava sp. DLFJ5-1 TaxID=1915314 RepID=UPI00143902AB|nr:M23 family metallopeptidase [Thioclava sp. DLFJ5-1]